MTTPEQALLAELAANGFSVHSVWELFGRKLNYKSIIPVLLRWLPAITDQKVKEAVVRALSVKWAKPGAAPLLVKEFEKAHDPSGIGMGWAIANALSVVADDSVFEELSQLVKNPKYGSSREMLAVALGNIKDARADDVLLDLLDDDEVAGHALIALRKRRTQKGRPKVERLINHPKSWVREEARKFLKKLSRT
jgi:hypothetical protein